MAVVPSGKFTKKGEIIWKAAPITPATVSRGGGGGTTPSVATTETKYYRTPSGTVTYRVGGAAPPTGSVEISKAEYGTPTSGVQPKEKEYLVREAKPSGEVGEWRSRKGVEVSALAAKGYGYQVGAVIPIKKEIDGGVAELRKKELKERLGLIASGLPVIKRTGYYKEPGGKIKYGTTISFLPTGAPILSKREQYIQKKEKQFMGSAFGKGYSELAGEFAVTGAKYVGRPAVEALTAPLPAKVKQRVKGLISEEEVREAGEIFPAKAYGTARYYLTTPKGLATTALTVGIFYAGGAALKTVTTGTKLAKAYTVGAKAVPYAVGGLWGGTHVISGGVRVAAGEKPLVAISKEAGAMTGEAIGFGAMAKGIKYAPRAIEAVIPKIRIPKKLAGARARAGYTAKGKQAVAWELTTEKGKPIKKWFWQKEPKVTEKVRMQVTSEIMKKQAKQLGLAYGREAVVEVSLKGKVPKITKVVTEEIIPKGVTAGYKIKLPEISFAKQKPTFELKGVKGYKRLQIKPTELISFERPAIKKYPYVSAKEVTVKPYIRRGAKISYEYVTEKPTKLGKIKAYEEAVLTPVKRPYVKKPIVIESAFIERKPTIKPTTVKEPAYGAIWYGKKGKPAKAIPISMKERGLMQAGAKQRLQLISLAKGQVQAPKKAYKPIVSYYKPKVTKAEKILTFLSAPTKKQLMRYPFVAPSDEYYAPKKVLAPPQKLMALTEIERKGYEPTKPTFAYAKLPKRELKKVSDVSPMIRKPTKVSMPKSALMPQIDIFKEYKPTVDITQKITPIQKQVPITIPKEELIPKGIKYPPIIPRPYKSLIKEPPFAPPFFRGFKLYEFIGGRKPKKIKERAYEYQPSLAAIGEWWVKVSKKVPSPKTSPIELRPIIVQSKKFARQLRKAGFLGSFY